MDLLSEFSIKAYEPPLSDLRWSGDIRDLSSPINVALLLIDFDTEVSMNGIADFIGNHAGLYALETVAALRVIECPVDADRLQEVLTIATAAGMTHDEIQRDRSRAAPNSITSFSALHGDKWRAALDAIYGLEDAIDFGRVMECLERYVEAHRTEFETALGRSPEA